MSNKKAFLNKPFFSERAASSLANRSFVRKKKLFNFKSQKTNIDFFKRIRRMNGQAGTLKREKLSNPTLYPFP